MPNKLMVCLLFLMIATTTKAQEAPQQTLGKITNESNLPIATANVTVFSLTDQPLLNLQSNEKGIFSFKRPAQKFYLSISHIGYISFKITQIGTDTLQIVLKNTNHLLNEVTVINKKPFLQQEIDKLVVNVDGDPKNGINSIDILKKIPGVMLKNGEELMVEGKSITVLIDGKPTRLSGNSLIAMLEGTPATGIEQLEIIYNPSSKYDAFGSGGLINIKTIKRVAPGYDATIGLGAGHGWKYPTGNGSVGLNYKKGNTNLYASYSVGLGKQYQEIETNTYQSDLNKKLQEFSVYKGNSKSNNFRLGMDQQLNKANALSFLITGYYNSRDPYSTADTKTYNLGTNELTEKTFATNPNNSLSKGLNANLNYKYLIGPKKDISFDIDAGIFDFNNHNENNIQKDKTTGTLIDQYYLQDGKTNSDIYSLKSDYTQQTKFGNFESGLKISSVHIENSFNSIFNDNILPPQDYGSNDFVYQENILAAYANNRMNFGKFSVLLGLRGEQTFTNGNSITANETLKRQYLNLFPNVTTGLKLKKITLSLAYNKRIGRPLYNELNPFVIINSAYTNRKGNPSLDPSYTDNFRFAFSTYNKLSMSVSYAYVKDVITDLTSRAPGSEISSALKSNLSSYKNIGFNANYSNKFFKILQLNYGLGISNSNYAFLYNQEQEIVKQTTAYLSLSNNVQLTPSLWAEVYFYGQSKVTYGKYINLPFTTTGVSAGKKLFKGNGNLSLSINDIFFSGYTKSKANYGNIVYDLFSRYDSRSARLNFSYRFGTAKIDLKKRNSGSEDEQRRNQ